MNKTKIEWCDSTWNPVTGCLHGCEYCYARKIATRYGFHAKQDTDSFGGLFDDRVLHSPAIMGGGRKCPYPFDFEPTFYKYRLDQPSNWNKPRTIFVCSMADLFGEWVPDEWIEAVFAACDKAPQHRYLFLTKNPKRYDELHQKGILRKRDNMWYGFSVTMGSYSYWNNPLYNVFASVEPILSPVHLPTVKWVIIGAETGTRKSKITPKKIWIDEMCKEADELQASYETLSNSTSPSKLVPIFMKDSLIPIVGEENMRREFPWEIS